MVIFVCLSALTITGYSQKGVGESKGISRQGLNPEIVTLKGTVDDIKVGPCKYTTGRFVSGTHLMVETTEKKTLNIHLGPTVEISKFVEGLEGKAIEVKAFRTKKLPDNNYIAKELTYQGETTVLRNETLKPFWAGRSGRENWGGRRRKN